jgi:hypothetical protein
MTNIDYHHHEISFVLVITYNYSKLLQTDLIPFPVLFGIARWRRYNIDIHQNRYSRYGACYVNAIINESSEVDRDDFRVETTTTDDAIVSLHAIGSKTAMRSRKHARVDSMDRAA